LIKEFDVTNIIIYLQKKTMENQSQICNKVQHDKKENWNCGFCKWVILYLCVNFLDLHYVIFAFIFGIYLPNFFTVQGSAIVSTPSWSR